MRTLILVLTLSGCTAGTDAFDGTELLSPGADLSPEHDWIAQAQTVDILLDVLSGERGPLADPSPWNLDIDVFDLRVRAELTRIDQGAGPTWVGAIEGDPFGEAVFSMRDGVLAGSLHTEGRVFTFGSNDDGEALLAELDTSQMPADGEPVEVSADPVAGDSAQGDASDTVEMLVVYTADALAAVGGTSAMDALIGVAIAETNQGYINSGATTRVSLAGTSQVTYSESGFNWSTTLGRLAGENDGFLDEVHPLRDAAGADQVTLMVNQTSYCGLAYLMSSPSASFAGSAFALVYHGCATGYYSFGHELGHNMGSTHDHANGSGGAFPYSYGYQDPSRAFRTVMAYNCPSGGCARVNYWSNPSVTYNGSTTGVGGSGSSAANNTASLGQTTSIVAGFRSSGSSPPTANAAQISSPTSLSQLNSTSVTFQWNATGADDYGISIGSTPGGRDVVHTASLSSNVTSFAATGLPEDGSTVYVRLWSEIDGDWEFVDTSYTAVDAVDQTPAQITSPSGGTTLSGSSVTMQWTDVGASEYRIFVGRYPGDRSIVDAGSFGTSLLLSSLPTDARPLYIRLYSRTSSGWLYSDRAITAASPPAPNAAEVQSPTPGSTLVDTDMDLEWSNVGADEYHLFVGYQQGARQLYSGSVGSLDNLQVTGLPDDGGAVHVRVWTRTGTDWSFTDSAYTASSGPVATAVSILSPTAGSNVGGGTATFAWSDEGADEYALFVGLAQGHRELFNSSMGTLTSQSISGLPTTDRDFWVRVWARVGTDWTYTDAQYTGTL